MRKIFKDRILKLATHLESKKLGHKVFDFNSWNGNEFGYDEIFDKKGCGTVGCAIGECPFAFPRSWSFKGAYFNPALNKLNSNSPQESAQQFFGLSMDEFGLLFVPSSGITPVRTTYGKKQLTRYATAKKVAERLRWFVKEKERREK